MTVVDDFRAVDPIAYITALGLQPEDAYGFLPLDVDDRASFIFVYRDRPGYAQARAGLPEASSSRPGPPPSCTRGRQGPAPRARRTVALASAATGGRAR